MRRVAIITDSGSDLDPAVAAAAGITVVPLLAIFGDQEFRAGVDLSAPEFWDRFSAPGAPFPRTSAASAGTFQAAFEDAFRGGAEAVVCVTLAGTLSATLSSAEMARDALPDREIHVVNSWSASMVEGILAQLGAEMADRGATATEIVTALAGRIPDLQLLYVMDTLEHLVRGGRIGRGRALVGAMLSMKPIMTINEGIVDIVDRPRTRTRARQRLVELATARPVERLALLYTPRTEDLDGLAVELAAGAQLPPAALSRQFIGPTIGPHVGPGAYGVAVLWRPEERVE
jgi:DegV family protein with EDD domain